jgi:hypothetical protein
MLAVNGYVYGQRGHFLGYESARLMLAVDGWVYGQRGHFVFHGCERREGIHVRGGVLVGHFSMFDSSWE